MRDFKDLQDKKLSKKNIYSGEVVSNTDPYENRTLRVRISELDNKISNENLPECYPAQSNFFHYVPKVGERVLVILEREYNADKTVNQEKRYYFCVTISQFQNINNDPYYYTANSNESDGWVRRGTPISEIPEAQGVYPKKDVIGLIGRDNTDVLLKDKEVLIRAGKHEIGNVLNFNRTDPVFIQMKYGLNRPSKQRKTRIVTKLKKISPTHSINISTDAKNRLMVKVIRKSDSFIEENFTESYSSRESLIKASRDKIREFQSQYTKWELRANEPELSDIPTLFPNNQRLVREEVEEIEENEFTEFAGSVMNIVADKINFLSHKSANNYNLADPTSQINEETQLEINSTAHPMVYGDRLVELLSLIKSFVQTHVHNYPGNPPIQADIERKIVNFDLNSLLDNNIRLG